MRVPADAAPGKAIIRFELPKNCGHDSIATDDGVPLFKAYPVPAGQAEAIAKVLQEVYNQSPSAHISAVGRSSILVYANPADQAKIGKSIATLSTVSDQPAPDRPETPGRGRQGGRGPPTPGGGGAGGAGFGGAGFGGIPSSERLDAMAESAFHRLDRNGDGVLNVDEMPEALQAQREKWDTDHNGVIDLNEYKAYLRARLGQRPMAARQASSPSSMNEKLDRILERLDRIERRLNRPEKESPSSTRPR